MTAGARQPMRLVITGASSGLGQAFAVEFARRYPGALMMLVARRADRLAELAARLPEACCECVALDVTDAVALRGACLDFTRRHGAPDIVIANAGISRRSRAAQPICHGIVTRERRARIASTARRANASAGIRKGIG